MSVRGKDRRFRGHPDRENPGAWAIRGIDGDDDADEEDLLDDQETVLAEQQTSHIDDPATTEEATAERSSLMNEFEQRLQRYENQMQEMLEQPRIEASLVEEPVRVHAIPMEIVERDDDPEEPMLTRDRPSEAVEPPLQGSSTHTPPNNSQPPLRFVGCCDMRRAVIFVNSILLLIVFLVFILMSILVATGKEVNDDQKQQDNEGTGSTAVGFLGFASFEILFVLIAGIMLVPNILGILGALRYNAWMVGATGTLYALSAIGCLSKMNWFSGLLFGLLAYPHFAFVLQMYQGIMTKENYHTIEYCSC